MAFWSNLFKPKKVIATTLIIAALLTAALKIKQEIKNHKELQKDPIVKLLSTNYDDFILLMDDANIAIQGNNIAEKKRVLEDLEAKRPQFEDSLFQRKYYEDLEKKGFHISDGEKQILFNMKSQYDPVVQELNSQVISGMDKHK